MRPIADKGNKFTMRDEISNSIKKILYKKVPSSADALHTAIMENLGVVLQKYRRWEMFHKKYIEGMTYQEIAEEYGVSRQAIYEVIEKEKGSKRYDRTKKHTIDLTTLIATCLYRLHKVPSKTAEFCTGSRPKTSVPLDVLEEVDKKYKKEITEYLKKIPKSTYKIKSRNTIAAIWLRSQDYSWPKINLLCGVHIDPQRIKRLIKDSTKDQINSYAPIGQEYIERQTAKESGV